MSEENQDPNIELTEGEEVEETEADKLKKLLEVQKKKELEEEIAKRVKDQVAAASDDTATLKADLAAALKENARLTEDKRSELLLLLDEKDQVAYKDKSVDSLQLLVTHLKQNPKVRGIERPAKGEKKKDDDKTAHEKDPGYIGGRDVRTGKRY